MTFSLTPLLKELENIEYESANCISANCISADCISAHCISIWVRGTEPSMLRLLANEERHMAYQKTVLPAHENYGPPERKPKEMKTVGNYQFVEDITDDEADDEEYAYQKAREKWFKTKYDLSRWGEYKELDKEYDSLSNKWVKEEYKNRLAEYRQAGLFTNKIWDM